MRKNRWACVAVAGLQALLMLGGDRAGAESTVDDLVIKDSATVLRETVLYGAVRVLATPELPTNGAVLYYALSDDGTVPDASGNGNTGTVYGATFVAGGGMPGGAYAFDGTNDYLDAGDIAALNGASQLTVSAWIKLETVSGGRMLVSKHRASDNSRVFALFVANGGALQFFVYPSGQSSNYVRQASSGVLATGVWYHVAGIWGAGGATNVDLYADGFEISSTATIYGTPAATLSDQPSAFRVGACEGVPGYYMAGRIDEVALYDRALAAEELRALYAYGLSGLPDAGSAEFHGGIRYLAPLGDLGMGVFTNRP